MSIRVDETQVDETQEAYQALLEQVLVLAKRGGWRHPSPTRMPGYAAVLLCKPGRLGSKGRLLFAQLQREGVPLSRPQEQWIAALSASVPGVEVFVWRPSDLAHIVETLTFPRWYA